MSLLAICLLIFVLMVIGFCSGKYSLATISLVSMMALVLTGCMEAKEALSYFSNSNVVMIAGMCVVAAGFNRTQFQGFQRKSEQNDVWICVNRYAAEPVYTEPHCGNGNCGTYADGIRREYGA